jgi:hypothetical protein
MTENNHFDSVFEGPEPITPVSVAPGLDELRVRMLRRRRHRKVGGATVIGGTIVLVFASVFWPTDIAPDTSISVNNANIAYKDGALPRKSPASSVLTESSDVRVFAKVWRQTPVFELEQETQHLHLVGWIDSEEVVPVDLSQFASEQRKTVEAVLHDTTERFNL